jgi:Heparinase II/III-like protein
LISAFVVSKSADFSAGLSAALSQYFDIAESPANGNSRRADVIIYQFEPDELADISAVEAAVSRGEGGTKLFLELPQRQLENDSDLESYASAIVDIAERHGGRVVPLVQKFQRWNPERMFEEGLPSKRGFKAIAKEVHNVQQNSASPGEQGARSYVKMLARKIARTRLIREKSVARDAKGAAQEARRSLFQTAAEPSDSTAGPLKVFISAPSDAFAAGLIAAFRDRTRKHNSRPVNPVARTAADAIIYAFDPDALHDPAYLDEQRRAIDADTAVTKIFLQVIPTADKASAIEKAEAGNFAITDLANAGRGYLIPLTSKLRRWDLNQMVGADGLPSLDGYRSIAGAIGKIVSRESVRVQLGERAPDDETSTDEKSAKDILKEIRWPNSRLPKIIKRPFGLPNLLEFADWKITFPTNPQWGMTDFSFPMDWAMPGPNRSWQSYFLGLEFLGPALSYYFLVAGRQPFEKWKLIESGLREHNVDAEILFRRAEQIIVDFAENNSPSAPQAVRAWHEGTVCRRVTILLIYLLCCKVASQRGVPVNEAALKSAYRSVLDCIELLRSDSIYIKAGNHGVRQDSLLIISSLLLSGAGYGAAVLREGVERLIEYQLKRAVSSDGVWLENSLGYHCMIMGTLSRIVADLRDANQDGQLNEADAIAEPISAAVRKMLTFAEALVKSDGVMPPLGDSEPAEYLPAIELAQQQLLAPGSKDQPEEKFRLRERSRDTFFFPDAGYFVSHTEKPIVPTSSEMIFFANYSTPKHKHADDLSVVFIRGASDLLLDGGTYNKEISDKIRNAARFDPASHNTYRVNGKGYPMRTVRSAKPAGLSKHWSETEWAAAAGFNSAYPDGEVVRYAIHLRHRHAAIVFDILKSKSDAAATFEQFWHVSPSFVPPSGVTPDTKALLFSSETEGALSVAFDPSEAAVAVERGNEDNPIGWAMIEARMVVSNPYIRRARTMKSGTMAAFFQWSEGPPKEPPTISIEAHGKKSWMIAGSGQGTSFRFEIGERGVICHSL